MTGRTCRCETRAAAAAEFPLPLRLLLLVFLLLLSSCSGRHAVESIAPLSKQLKPSLLRSSCGECGASSRLPAHGVVGFIKGGSSESLRRITSASTSPSSLSSRLKVPSGCRGGNRGRSFPPRSLRAAAATNAPDLEAAIKQWYPWIGPPSNLFVPAHLVARTVLSPTLRSADQSAVGVPVGGAGSDSSGTGTSSPVRDGSGLHAAYWTRSCVRLGSCSDVANDRSSGSPAHAQMPARAVAVAARRGADVDDSLLSELLTRVTGFAKPDGDAATAVAGRSSTPLVPGTWYPRMSRTGRRHDAMKAFLELLLLTHLWQQRRRGPAQAATSTAASPLPPLAPPPLAPPPPPPLAPPPPHHHHPTAAAACTRPATGDSLLLEPHEAASDASEANRNDGAAAAAAAAAAAIPMGITGSSNDSGGFDDYNCNSGGRDSKGPWSENGRLDAEELHLAVVESLALRRWLSTAAAAYHYEEAAGRGVERQSSADASAPGGGGGAARGGGGAASASRRCEGGAADYDYDYDHLGGREGKLSAAAARRLAGLCLLPEDPDGRPTPQLSLLERLDVDINDYSFYVCMCVWMYVSE
eukprot:GHVU01123180.1.p1 GENE.GHVU01123180.1~~GHVU01123180.1.p1  ORF type:complete len:584 (-),score=90.37 GHVU01123180.1:239-1990(-)